MATTEELDVGGHRSLIDEVVIGQNVEVISNQQASFKEITQSIGKGTEDAQKDEDGETKVNKSSYMETSKQVISTVEADVGQHDKDSVDDSVSTVKNLNNVETLTDPCLSPETINRSSTTDTIPVQEKLGETKLKVVDNKETEDYLIASAEEKDSEATSPSEEMGNRDREDNIRDSIEDASFPSAAESPENKNGEEAALDIEDGIADQLEGSSAPKGKYMASPQEDGSTLEGMTKEASSTECKEKNQDTTDLKRQEKYVTPIEDDAQSNNNSGAPFIAEETCLQKVDDYDISQLDPKISVENFVMDSTKEVIKRTDCYEEIPQAYGSAREGSKGVENYDKKLKAPSMASEEGMQGKGEDLDRAEASAGGIRDNEELTAVVTEDNTPRIELTEAIEQRKLASMEHGGRPELSLLQQSEPEKEKPERPLNVISEEIETAVSAENFEFENPDDSSKEKGMDDQTTATCDINGPEIPEQKNLSQVHLNEKTESAEAETPNNNANNPHFRHSVVEETQVEGKRTDAVSDFELGDKIQRPDGICEHEKRQVASASEADQSAERKISEHTSTEGTVRVEMIAKTTDIKELEKVYGLDSRDKLEVKHAEANIPEATNREEAMGMEIHTITTESNNIEEDLPEDDTTKAHSTVNTGDEASKIQKESQKETASEFSGEDESKNVAKEEAHDGHKTQASGDVDKEKIEAANLTCLTPKLSEELQTAMTSESLTDEKMHEDQCPGNSDNDRIAEAIKVSVKVTPQYQEDSEQGLQINELGESITVESPENAFHPSLVKQKEGLQGECEDLESTEASTESRDREIFSINLAEDNDENKRPAGSTENNAKVIPEAEEDSDHVLKNNKPGERNHEVESSAEVTDSMKQGEGLQEDTENLALPEASTMNKDVDTTSTKEGEYKTENPSLAEVTENSAKAAPEVEEILVHASPKDEPRQGIAGETICGAGSPEDCPDSPLMKQDEGLQEECKKPITEPAKEKRDEGTSCLEEAEDDRNIERAAETTENNTKVTQEGGEDSEKVRQIDAPRQNIVGLTNHNVESPEKNLDILLVKQEESIEEEDNNLAPTATNADTLPVKVAENIDNNNRQVEAMENVVMVTPQSEEDSEQLLKKQDPEENPENGRNQEDKRPEEILDDSLVNKEKDRQGKGEDISPAVVDENKKGSAGRDGTEENNAKAPAKGEEDTEDAAGEGIACGAEPLIESPEKNPNTPLVKEDEGLRGEDGSLLSVEEKIEKRDQIICPSEIAEGNDDNNRLAEPAEKSAKVTVEGQEDLEQAQKEEGMEPDPQGQREDTSPAVVAEHKEDSAGRDGTKENNTKATAKGEEDTGDAAGEGIACEADHEIKSPEKNLSTPLAKEDEGLHGEDVSLITEEEKIERRDEIIYPLEIAEGNEYNNRLAEPAKKSAKVTVEGQEELEQAQKQEGMEADPQGKGEDTSPVEVAEHKEDSAGRDGTEENNAKATSKGEEDTEDAAGESIACEADHEIESTKKNLSTPLAKKDEGLHGEDGSLVPAEEKIERRDELIGPLEMAEGNDDNNRLAEPAEKSAKVTVEEKEDLEQDRKEEGMEADPQGKGEDTSPAVVAKHKEDTAGRDGTEENNEKATAKGEDTEDAAGEGIACEAEPLIESPEKNPNTPLGKDDEGLHGEDGSLIPVEEKIERRDEMTSPLEIAEGNDDNNRLAEPAEKSAKVTVEEQEDLEQAQKKEGMEADPRGKGEDTSPAVVAEHKEDSAGRDGTEENNAKATAKGEEDTEDAAGEGIACEADHEIESPKKNLSTPLAKEDEGLHVEDGSLIPVEEKIDRRDEIIGPLEMAEGNDDNNRLAEPAEKSAKVTVEEQEDLEQARKVEGMEANPQGKGEDTSPALMGEHREDSAGRDGTEEKSAKATAKGEEDTEDAAREGIACEAEPLIESPEKNTNTPLVKEDEGLHGEDGSLIPVEEKIERRDEMTSPLEIAEGNDDNNRLAEPAEKSAKVTVEEQEDLEQAQKKEGMEADPQGKGEDTSPAVVAEHKEDSAGRDGTEENNAKATAKGEEDTEDAAGESIACEADHEIESPEKNLSTPLAKEDEGLHGEDGSLIPVEEKIDRRDEIIGALEMAEGNDDNNRLAEPAEKSAKVTVEEQEDLEQAQKVEGMEANPQGKGEDTSPALMGEHREDSAGRDGTEEKSAKATAKGEEDTEDAAREGIACEAEPLIESPEKNTNTPLVKEDEGLHGKDGSLIPVEEKIERRDEIISPLEIAEGNDDNNRLAEPAEKSAKLTVEEQEDLEQARKEEGMEADPRGKGEDTSTAVVAEHKEDSAGRDGTEENNAKATAKGEADTEDAAGEGIACEADHENESPEKNLSTSLAKEVEGLHGEDVSLITEEEKIERRDEIIYPLEIAEGNEYNNRLDEPAKKSAKVTVEGQEDLEQAQKKEGMEANPQGKGEDTSPAVVGEHKEDSAGRDGTEENNAKATAKGEEDTEDAAGESIACEADHEIERAEKNLSTPLAKEDEGLHGEGGSLIPVEEKIERRDELIGPLEMAEGNDDNNRLAEPAEKSAKVTVEEQEDLEQARKEEGMEADPRGKGEDTSTAVVAEHKEDSAGRDGTEENNAKATAKGEEDTEDAAGESIACEADHEIESPEKNLSTPLAKEVEGLHGEGGSLIPVEEKIEKRDEIIGPLEMAEGNDDNNRLAEPAEKSAKVTVEEQEDLEQGRKEEGMEADPQGKGEDTSPAVVGEHKEDSAGRDGTEENNAKATAEGEEDTDNAAGESIACEADHEIESREKNLGTPLAKEVEGLHEEDGSLIPMEEKLERRDQIISPLEIAEGKDDNNRLAEPAKKSAKVTVEEQEDLEQARKEEGMEADPQGKGEDTSPALVAEHKEDTAGRDGTEENNAKATAKGEEDTEDAAGESIACEADHEIESPEKNLSTSLAKEVEGLHGEDGTLIPVEKKIERRDEIMNPLEIAEGNDDNNRLAEPAEKSAKVTVEEQEDLEQAHKEEGMEADPRGKGEDTSPAVVAEHKEDSAGRDGTEENNAKATAKGEEDTEDAAGESIACEADHEIESPEKNLSTPLAKEDEGLHGEGGSLIPVEEKIEKRDEIIGPLEMAEGNDDNNRLAELAEKSGKVTVEEQEDLEQARKEEGMEADPQGKGEDTSPAVVGEHKEDSAGRDGTEENNAKATAKGEEDTEDAAGESIACEADHEIESPEKNLSTPLAKEDEGLHGEGGSLIPVEEKIERRDELIGPLEMAEGNDDNNRLAEPAEKSAKVTVEELEDLEQARKEEEMEANPQGKGEDTSPAAVAEHKEDSAGRDGTEENNAKATAEGEEDTDNAAGESIACEADHEIESPEKNLSTPLAKEVEGLHGEDGSLIPVEKIIKRRDEILSPLEMAEGNYDNNRLDEPAEKSAKVTVEEQEDSEQARKEEGMEADPQGKGEDTSPAVVGEHREDSAGRDGTEENNAKATAKGEEDTGDAAGEGIACDADHEIESPEKNLSTPTAKEDEGLHGEDGSLIPVEEKIEKRDEIICQIEIAEGNDDNNRLAEPAEKSAKVTVEGQEDLEQARKEEGMEADPQGKGEDTSPAVVAEHKEDTAGRDGTEENNAKATAKGEEDTEDAAGESIACESDHEIESPEKNLSTPLAKEVEGLHGEDGSLIPVEEKIEKRDEIMSPLEIAEGNDDNNRLAEPAEKSAKVEEQEDLEQARKEEGMEADPQGKGEDTSPAVVDEHKEDSAGRDGTEETNAKATAKGEEDTEDAAGEGIACEADHEIESPEKNLGTPLAKEDEGLHGEDGSLIPGEEKIERRDELIGPLEIAEGNDDNNRLAEPAEKIAKVTVEDQGDLEQAQKEEGMEADPQGKGEDTSPAVVAEHKEDSAGRDGTEENNAKATAKDEEDTEDAAEEGILCEADHEIESPEKNLSTPPAKEDEVLHGEDGRLIPVEEKIERAEGNDDNNRLAEPAEKSTKVTVEGQEDLEQAQKEEGMEAESSSEKTNNKTSVKEEKIFQNIEDTSETERREERKTVDDKKEKEAAGKEINEETLRHEEKIISNSDRASTFFSEEADLKEAGQENKVQVESVDNKENSKEDQECEGLETAASSANPEKLNPEKPATEDLSSSIGEVTAKESLKEDQSDGTNIKEEVKDTNMECTQEVATIDLTEETESRILLDSVNTNKDFNALITADVPKASEEEITEENLRQEKIINDSESAAITSVSEEGLKEAGPENTEVKDTDNKKSSKEPEGSETAASSANPNKLNLENPTNEDLSSSIGEVTESLKENDSDSMKSKEEITDTNLKFIQKLGRIDLTEETKSRTLKDYVEPNQDFSALTTANVSEPSEEKIKEETLRQEVDVVNDPNSASLTFVSEEGLKETEPENYEKVNSPDNRENSNDQEQNLTSADLDQKLDAVSNSVTKDQSDETFPQTSKTEENSNDVQNLSSESDEQQTKRELQHDTERKTAMQVQLEAEDQTDVSQYPKVTSTSVTTSEEVHEGVEKVDGSGSSKEKDEHGQSDLKEIHTVYAGDEILEKVKDSRSKFTEYLKPTDSSEQTLNGGAKEVPTREAGAPRTKAPEEEKTQDEGSLKHTDVPVTKAEDSEEMIKEEIKVEVRDFHEKNGKRIAVAAESILEEVQMDDKPAKGTGSAETSEKIETGPCLQAEEIGSKEPEKTSSSLVSQLSNMDQKYVEKTDSMSLPREWEHETTTAFQKAEGESTKEVEMVNEKNINNSSATKATEETCLEEEEPWELEVSQLGIEIPKNIQMDSSNSVSKEECCIPDVAEKVETEENEETKCSPASSEIKKTAVLTTPIEEPLNPSFEISKKPFDHLLDVHSHEVLISSEEKVHDGCTMKLVDDSTTVAEESFKNTKEEIRVEVDNGFDKTENATEELVTTESSSWEAQLHDMSTKDTISHERSLETTVVESSPLAEEVLSMTCEKTPSILPSQLQNTIDGNTEKETLEIPDAYEAEETKTTSDAVSESTHQSVRETDETGQSLKAEKLDATDVEEIKETSESLCKPEATGVEVVGEGRTIADQTLQAGMSTEQLQILSSSIPSREQEQGTMTTEERMQKQNMKEIEAQGSENIDDSSADRAIEGTWLKKKEVRELEVPKDGCETAKAIKRDDLDQVQKEESNTVVQALNLDPREREEIKDKDSSSGSEVTTELTRANEEASNLNFEINEKASDHEPQGQSHEVLTILEDISEKHLHAEIAGPSTEESQSKETVEAYQISKNEVPIEGVVEENIVSKDSKSALHGEEKVVDSHEGVESKTTDETNKMLKGTANLDQEEDFRLSEIVEESSASERIEEKFAAKDRTVENDNASESYPAEAEEKNVEEPATKLEPENQKGETNLIMGKTEVVTPREKEVEVEISPEGGTTRSSKANEITQNTQQLGMTSYAASKAEISEDADPCEKRQTILPFGHEDFPPVPQHPIDAAFQKVEAEYKRPGKATEIDAEEREVVSQGEKKTSDSVETITEESTSVESAKFSLSDLMQRSMKENWQATKDLTKDREQTDIQDKGAETTQISEAKTDEEEGDEHKRTDLGSDAPVMVEVSKDIDVKVAHKKSHNILSGVGSKVKHSISRVKKAITGKSSQPKTSSPK